MSTPAPPNVATAPRQLSEIRSRQAIAFLFRATRALARKAFGRATPKELVISPPVTSIGTAGDLANRLAWYLPNHDVRIYMPLTATAMGEVQSTAQLPVPRAQSRFTDRLPNNVIPTPSGANVSASASRLVHRWPEALRGIRRIRHTLIVDPLFYSMDESMAWATLQYETLTAQERERQRQRSIAVFKDFLAVTQPLKSAYVFTTGPSIDRAEEFAYPAESLKIICNSMVKNTALLEKIRPQLIVFADPVFHFSPCVYASEFRKHAVAAAIRHDAYVMVPEVHLGLMKHWHPELEQRLIGMPLTHSGDLNVPAPDRFFVRATGNIMTLFMIPTAATSPRPIYVIGADGRSPTENYFWKHSSQNQFDDLMQTVFDTHPSFFRDRVYTDYYDSHVKRVAELIDLVEDSGSRVKSLTPSHIPSLAARPA